MTRQTLFLVIWAGVLLLISGCVSEPGPVSLNGDEIKPHKGVDPIANEILYEASKYLMKAKTLQFTADVKRDVIFYDGIRVQFGGRGTLTMKRPNKLRAVFTGDEQSRRSYFDGKTLIIYNVKDNVYAKESITGTIDNAIDHVYEKYGFSVPLGDLIYSDPYAVLIENVNRGCYVGLHDVDGKQCNHLSFQQEDIDWQIWIEADNTPLIRRLVITYKNEEGCPEFQANISNWRLNLPVSDADFEFSPPETAEEIEFLPIQQISRGGKAPQNRSTSKGEEKKP